MTVEEKKLLKENYLLLTEVYENLLRYYFYQRNYIKFNLYQNKLLKLKDNLYKNLPLTLEDKSLIKIRIFISKAFKQVFNRKNDNSLINFQSNFKIVLKESEKIKNVEYCLFSYLSLGTTESALNNNEEAKKYFLKGYKLASENSIKSEIMLFDTRLMQLEFLNNNNNSKLFLDKIESYYIESEKEINNKRSFFHIHLHYAKLLAFCGHYNKYVEVYKNFIDRLILSLDKIEAASRWYELQSVIYTNNIYSWRFLNEEESENRLQISLSVNKSALEIFEKVNYKALYFKNIYSSTALAIVYLNQIELEYWKGENCNLDNAKFFIDKVDRLIKTRHIIINFSRFASLKLGIKIFEDLKISKKENTFYKYSSEMKQLIKELKNQKQNFNIITDLAILYYLAQNLNVKNCWIELRKLEKWLFKNKQDIIDSIKQKSETTIKI